MLPDNQKIKQLLDSKDKMKARIERLELVFQEERETDELDPEYDGSRLQVAESDLQLMVSQLQLIEKALKDLGYES